MSDFIAAKMADPQFILGMLVALGTFATLITTFLPALQKDNLEGRMKSVVSEREYIRARERERLNNEKPTVRLNEAKGRLKEIVEQFKLQAQFFSVHVPYRGIGPAFTDLMGGQTQALFPGLAAALPHIKSGKVRALAVTGLKRHPLIPDVPTFAELGYAGFDGVQWYGIVGPAKLPDKITARLNEEINKAINNPELKERLSAEAIQPMPMAPDAFGQYIRQDIARWTAVAKERRIEID
jgi:hypothetical protein